MKTQNYITIQKPCPAKFETFKKTTQGGFCNTCKKEVIDFSGMPSKEIAKHIYKNTNSTNRICGRLKSSQLNIIIPSKKRSKTLSFFSGIGMACLALFSFNNTEAQEIKPKDTNLKSQNLTNNLIVKGTVTTADDGLALPGANIVLQGTAIGTQTNFDGKFEFPKKLKTGDVLIISYVGLEPQKITIQKPDNKLNINLKVVMSSDEIILMGEIDVKKIYSSKTKQ